MKNTLIAWLFCLPFASCTSPVTQMDLSGQWTVCLDSTDVGMASFGGKLFDTSITLPGTTDEAHLGTKCTLKPALESKHSKKCTFYILRFGCSFAAVNTIKPQLL